MVQPRVTAGLAIQEALQQVLRLIPGHRPQGLLSQFQATRHIPLGAAEAIIIQAVMTEAQAPAAVTAEAQAPAAVTAEAQAPAAAIAGVPEVRQADLSVADAVQEDRLAAVHVAAAAEGNSSNYRYLPKFIL